MAVMPERRAMPPDGHPLIDFVEWYTALGYPIFPVAPVSKIPLFESPHKGDKEGQACRGECGQLGHGLYDATMDMATLRNWWAQTTNANIGLVVPAHWVVVDVDSAKGGCDTLRELERTYAPLPPTVTSLTGSGGGSAHYCFTIPPGTVVRGKLGKGIDIRKFGNYLVVEPSIHPSGGKYRWDLAHCLGDEEPAPAPAWLLELLTNPHAPAGSQPSDGPSAAFDPRAWLAQPWTISDGERNDSLFHLTSFLHRQGKPMSEVYPLIVGYNTLYCSPPMTVAEIDATMMRSVPQYEVNPQLLVAGAPPANDITWKVGDPPPAAERFRFALTDADDILDREYPLPKWLIQDLIPEGLVFFVGSPKSSKTYLAYSLALSLVLDTLSEQPWLGHYPVLNPGPVVYITLEDEEGDSKERMLELVPGLAKIGRNRLMFHHGFRIPSLGEEMITALKEDIIAPYHPSMIVLDPISYLYASSKKGADQFAEVREQLLPLRWLGREHHCTILGIDHRRKKSAEDVDIFETTYGSNAKPAIADAILMIIREAQEVTIHVRERRAADQTLTLAFTFDADGHAHWEWKGAVDGLLTQGQYGDLRQKVIEALSGFQQPMSMVDLIAALKLPDSRVMRNNLYQILFKAQRNNEVQKTTRGQYVWAGGN